MSFKVHLCQPLCVQKNQINLQIQHAREQGFDDVYVTIERDELVLFNEKDEIVCTGVDEIVERLNMYAELNK